MASAVRLENENIGSHHFDAIREQDEAEALEEVRLKEKELEAEAMHAFDDLLDHSGSEASSYYKPPVSQVETQNAKDALNQKLQSHIEFLQAENQGLLEKISVLREELTKSSTQRAAIEQKLEKSEARIGLLEEELTELSDVQTVHRVKDQYEAILEKVKTGFNREKAELLQQLTKYKDEAMKARDHVCPENNVGSVAYVEGELKQLRDTIESLRRKELDLQLLVKDQSMLLKERECPEEISEHLTRLCDTLNVDKDSCVQTTIFSCITRVSDLKKDLNKLNVDYRRQAQLCEELRLAATLLEKENHVLKEKSDNSDTESHSETTRIGTLRTAMERLEEENLRLKLKIQSSEETQQRLQIEMKNRINNDSRNSNNFKELTEENKKLLLDLKQAREYSMECKRSQEMLEENLQKARENYDREKRLLCIEIENNSREKWQKEVCRLELQLEEEVTNRNSIIEKLRKTCGQMLESRLAKICEEKDSEIEKIIAKAREEAEIMHEKLTNLQDEIEEMRREAHQSKESRAELERKLDKVRNDLEDARDEIALKVDKIQRMQSTADDMKIEKEAKIGQLAEMEKKIRFLENLVKTGKIRMEKVNREKEIFESEKLRELRECLLKLDAVTKRCGLLERQLTIQKAEVVQSAGDGILQETCEKLLRELEDTRGKLATAVTEQEILRAKLVAKFETMKKVRQDLRTFQEQGKRYFAERQELSQVIDQLKADVERRRLKNSDLRDVITAIADKVITRLLNQHKL